MEGILSNKQIVVMGVANKHSIAWGCAQAMEKQGATVIYTYQTERMKKASVGWLGMKNVWSNATLPTTTASRRLLRQLSRFGKVDGLFMPLPMPRRIERLDSKRQS